MRLRAAAARVGRARVLRGEVVLDKGRGRVEPGDPVVRRDRWYVSRSGPTVTFVSDICEGIASRSRTSARRHAPWGRREFGAPCSTDSTAETPEYHSGDRMSIGTSGSVSAMRELACLVALRLRKEPSSSRLRSRTGGGGCAGHRADCRARKSLAIAGAGGRARRRGCLFCGCVSATRTPANMHTHAHHMHPRLGVCACARLRRHTYSFVLVVVVGGETAAAMSASERPLARAPTS